MWVNYAIDTDNDGYFDEDEKAKGNIKSINPQSNSVEITPAQLEEFLANRERVFYWNKNEGNEGYLNGYKTGYLYPPGSSGQGGNQLFVIDQATNYKKNLS